MDPLVLRGFVDEMEKQALSAALLARYAAKRGAQGVRSAQRLGKQLATVKPGMTSRQIAQGQAGGMAKGLLGATREGGQQFAKAQGLSAKSGVSSQRAAFQARGRAMDKALRTDVGSVTSPVRGGQILERGYSPQAQNFMAGKGTLAQAQQGTQAFPSVLTPKGVIPGAPGRVAASGAGGGTAVARPSRMAASGAGGGTAAARPSRMRAASGAGGATAIARPGGVRTGVQRVAKPATTTQATVAQRMPRAA